MNGLPKFNWRCFVTGHKSWPMSRWLEVPGSRDIELWVFMVCKRCRRVTDGHDTLMRSRRGKKPWRDER